MRPITPNNPSSPNDPLKQIVSILQKIEANTAKSQQSQQKQAILDEKQQLRQLTPYQAARVDLWQQQQTRLKEAQELKREQWEYKKEHGQQGSGRSSQLGRQLLGMAAGQTLSTITDVIHEPDVLKALVRGVGGFTGGMATVGGGMMMSGGWKQRTAGGIITALGTIGKIFTDLAGRDIETESQLFPSLETSIGQFGGTAFSRLKPFYDGGKEVPLLSILGKGVVSGYEGFGTKLGYSIPEIAGKHAALARGLGHGFSVEVGSAGRRALENALAMERVGLADTGMMEAMMRAGRSDMSGMNFNERFAGAVRMVGGTGDEDSDWTMVNEALQTLIEIERQQLQQFGRYNTAVNQGLLRELRGLGGIFSNLEVTAQTFNRLQANLGTATTPQVEALQYHALSRINPEGSLWDLAVQRSKPLSENLDYFGQYWKNMKAMSASRDMMGFNLHNTLLSGAKEHQVDEFMKSIENIGIDEFIKRVRQGSTDEARLMQEVQRRGEEATSDAAYRIAAKANELIINAIEDLRQTMEELKKVAEEMRISNGLISKALEAIGDPNAPGGRRVQRIRAEHQAEILELSRKMEQEGMLSQTDLNRISSIIARHTGWANSAIVPIN